ncbi:MAG: flagellar motor switch phosphatase FliY [Clostridiales bacterium]|nr:flagellar motor switch phosphatase FliY [Clostridiales bacterium]
MGKRNLSDGELNAIGEVLNISASSAAVAISTILNKQINISTSKVILQEVDEINLIGYDDGLIIDCSYRSGLLGKYAVLIRKIDIQTILNLLMNIENEDVNEFSFDEFSLSTINEIANQMLNSSSSSLSEFLNIKIEIEPPETKLFEGRDSIKEALDIGEEKIAYISLKIDINGVLNSDLILLISLDTANAINKLTSYNKEVKEEKTSPQAKEPKESGDNTTSNDSQVHDIRNEITVGSILNLNQPQSNHSVRIRNSSVSVQETQFPNFSENTDNSVLSSPLLKNNMDLLMNVLLDVSIELGKTKIKMKDILDFAQGTVINLEKQAGAPVEVIVNGQLIARGDVVVIDDNFGVRITEIVGDSSFLLNKF